MARPRHARFVALTTLLKDHPDVVDPAQAVEDRRVHVDGRIITNPRARVPANASIRIRPARPLRGETKLGRGLDALAIDVTGAPPPTSAPPPAGSPERSSSAEPEGSTPSTRAMASFSAASVRIRAW